jgi:hypothetical protein
MRQFFAFLFVLCLSSCGTPAYAHEHQAGETAEQAQTTEWLRRWRRPTGEFAGVPHRHDPCCYVDGKDQDCFLVKERRIVDGVLEVFPESEGHPLYDRWYPVNTGVTEEDQKDPRDSPDGRSYVCISGQLVICFVNGSGT